MLDGERKGGCPVVHYDYVTPRPKMTFFAEIDDLRDQSPFWNSFGTGFWAVLRYDQIVELTRNAEVFVESTFDPLDPEPDYRFIPNHTEDPEHAEYRTVLNRWFSPDGVERITPRAREICIHHIEKVKTQGQCDFVRDFAIRYPTEVFLSEALGLSPDEADFDHFLSMIKMFFDGFAGDSDKSLAAEASRQVQDYYHALLERRRARPRDPRRDFMTYLIQSEVFGRLMDDTEILDIMMTITTAGLDTTRSALGYFFHHMASHPADRRRLVDDPRSIPRAVEESLRLYSIILSDARVLTRDFEFHGARMRKGDIVWFSPTAGNRDPAIYPDPTAFEIDRRGRGHLSFGSGIHRCVGSHLARKEIVIAVEEWHRRIPDYELSDGGSGLERGVMLSLDGLPLRWSAA